MVASFSTFVHFWADIWPLTAFSSYCNTTTVVPKMCKFLKKLSTFEFISNHSNLKSDFPYKSNFWCSGQMMHDKYVFWAKTFVNLTLFWEPCEPNQRIRGGSICFFEVWHITKWVEAPYSEIMSKTNSMFHIMKMVTRLKPSKYLRTTALQVYRKVWRV